MLFITCLEIGFFVYYAIRNRGVTPTGPLPTLETFRVTLYNVKNYCY
jgi:hypothetical protein